MLVLSRLAGQVINIGNDITVKVVRISGDRISLAIEAPRSVKILRGELKDTSRYEPQEGRDE